MLYMWLKIALKRIENALNFLSRLLHCKGPLLYVYVVSLKRHLKISDVPNSGKGLVRLKYRTEEWDCDFTDYLKKLDAKKPVIMCGDLNVAHTPVGKCVITKGDLICK